MDKSIADARSADVAVEMATMPRFEERLSRARLESEDGHSLPTRK